MAVGLGGGGRDMQQAVIVGVGLVGLMAVCFLIGAWAVVALATVVVVLATAEFFTATRRSGYHPAPLIGLAGSGGMVLAAYLRGEGGMVLVSFLVVVTTLCWWLFDAGPGDHAVANAGITLLGVFYVGGLGSFASLLLRIDDASVSASGALVSGFGDSVGRSLLFGAILVTVAADIGALFVGQRMGRSPLTAASPNKTVEGLVGGIIASVVVSVLVLGIIGVGPWTAIDALVLGVVAGVMTPLGRPLRVPAEAGSRPQGHGHPAARPRWRARPLRRAALRAPGDLLRRAAARGLRQHPVTIVRSGCVHRRPAADGRTQNGIRA